MYEIYLFFHIVGAVVWIGFGLAGHALLGWAQRNREWAFAVTADRAFLRIEPAVGVAGPLLLLATGIALVLEGPWSFSDTWIVIGLIGYGAALAVGAVFLGPGTRRLAAIAAERGADDAAAISLRRRLNGFMWLELAILVVVLLAMATKPTDGGSAAFWIATAAILGGSAVPAARDLRASSSPAAPSDPR